MTDEELRQACLLWKASYDVNYMIHVDDIMRFARQQQAVGVRMAAKHLRPTDGPRDFVDIQNWCEDRAKELEA